MAEKHLQPVQVKVALEQAQQLNIKKNEPIKPDSEVAEKHWGKQTFLKFMKPIIERENKRILQERQRLLAWKKNNNVEARNLELIARHYQVQWTGKADGRFWRAILDRVDEVPLELALMQAANESSWGNSRFARQGNNYFGQWCFTKGCGLVPLRRNAGATHEVRKFASVDLSVRAYMYNLNTLQSYKLLRNLRRSLRRRGKPLDAVFLAIGLKDYSERGMDYVHIIQGMIRSNKQLIHGL
ncbi:MAG: glucosaminidase domain-containing protein [Mariprofundaceae bacterium]|nr:glucosaminidase domain-containing protein [Mariprofundaceae bacterium]